MDLRNYGVVDFAEHVVLPSGDADDLHALTHGNIEVGDWWSNGKKAQRIKDLEADLAKAKADLAKDKAELHKVQLEYSVVFEKWILCQQMLAEKNAELLTLKKTNESLIRLSEQNATEIDRMTQIEKIYMALQQHLVSLSTEIDKGRGEVNNEILIETIKKMQELTAPAKKKKKKKVTWGNRRKLA